MALNPFFLHGSPGEQRLLQDLTNELLRTCGMEITYIPRKYVKKQTILEEIQSSKFDDNFSIEAYLINYDGFTGSGDVLSKFGVTIKDELTLAISKERFEDFIANFLSSMNSNEIEVSTRPREGDLIYFPLGQKLFEVKFVEHESNFYQLGKLYHYELTCELFEYEDEVIDTTVEDIDTRVEDVGYITELQLISAGTTSILSANVGSGYISRVYLNNDGNGYITPPIVTFSDPPFGGRTATAVAITTQRGGVYSVKRVEILDAGEGYIDTPTITFSHNIGTGAAATCQLQKTAYGLISVNVDNAGSGYTKPPTITLSAPTGIGETAQVVAYLHNNGISTVTIVNSGYGYTTGTPIVFNVESPSILVGSGNYEYNEIVTGSISGTVARVKRWDLDQKILKVSINSGQFYPGELIVGSASSAIYSVKTFSDYNITSDKYNQNEVIQNEGSNIVVIDYNDKNPFGVF